MRKRLSWGAVLSLMIIVVAVTVCVTMLVAMRRFNAQVNELSNRQAMYTYISDTDNAIRRNYYGTIDEEVLRHAMAAGEVAGIGDPYARFYTSAQYSAWQERLSGQSTGFGITVAQNSVGEVVVATVQKGSTAYSAGLQKGDIVTALNKSPLGDNPLESVQTALENNLSIILTVKREESETAFELSSSVFTRESIESSTVGGTTGYIRFKAITDATPEQLKAAYSTLKSQGVQSVVLDLRGISEGSPEAAKKVLSFLLPYGMYGYYADNSGVTELRAEESSMLDLPAAVLVNSKTAGEAELIAAALKQAGLAKLVGNTTAGRAKVQDCFPLTSDNSAVCITVGEFRLLNSSNWEGTGLTPDIAASLTAEQEAALDLLKPETDKQLQAALAALVSSDTTTTTTETTTAADTGETSAEETAPTEAQ